MSKILIVDDEEVYRRHLELALAPGGHEIATASSGREAIDVGARYRPDILVTDWMLKNHLHGLHVARVLRSVLPDMQAILVTGFPSEDLRANADKAHVFDFIEKPFERDRIQTAVQAAGAAEKPKHEHKQPMLAVIEVDSSGSILFASSRAKELFAETRAGRRAASLADLFSPETVPDLDAAIDHWAVVSPGADRPVVWHLRSQSPLEGHNRLIVLRLPGDSKYVHLALVGTLLGFKDPEHCRWPFKGRVLVIDDELLDRGFSVSLLESVGAGCYAVESPAEALRLLATDDGLRFVLLDYHIPETTPRTTVEQIRGVRPDAVIVGTSGAFRQDDFAAIGVERFLLKPWRIDDLINAFAGRLGTCLQCDLPIPLRRPQPGEAASSWVCSNCGAVYRAVFDDDAPPETLQNVRPGNEG